MTIKDIAKEAGYGVGTVSRVLNNNPNVSEEARQRIMEVVEKYHFRPNSNARHLKTQVSYGIALIVKGVQNMLFMPMVEKIQRMIEERGYGCVLYYIDEEDNEVEAARRILLERNPYGIMFLGSNMEYFQGSLSFLDVPAILVTNSSASLNIPNLSSISVDDSEAASSVIDYLYELGHRKIGIIGGYPDLSRPSLLRMTGCQGAMFRHHLEFDEEKQYAMTRFSAEGGYAAANRLLDRCPEMTAVFAMSDLMAIGALRAFHERGLRVPDDISIVGFDGIPLGAYMIPRLTTVRQNADRFAERSVEILLHCIREGVSSIHEIVPYELVEGESVRRR